MNVVLELGAAWPDCRRQMLMLPPKHYHTLSSFISTWIHRTRWKKVWDLSSRHFHLFIANIEHVSSRHFRCILPAIFTKSAEFNIQPKRSGP
jgi:hypothetical protein